MQEDSRAKKKGFSLIHAVIDRFALGPIWRKVLARRVPKTSWYYGDGATLFFLLIVLVLTGCALGLMYSAEPSTAYESVVAITKQHMLGWFVRALHYWSAGMMLLICLYHLSRHILLGGYLPPREGSWIIGVLMFGLIVINSFLGYTLRWDERAIYAIRVALNMFHRIPFIGDEVVWFIQGGWTQGEATLSRFFAVHVLFVPLALLGLASYHLYLVVYHGVTTIPERIDPVETADEQRELYDELKKSNRHGTHFFPNTMAESTLFTLVIFSIVFALALIFGPAPLMPEANLSEISYPQEEWWFHWYSALIAYLPPWLTSAVYILFPLLAFLFLLALPFLDHGANRGLRRRPLAVTLIVAGIVALLSLTELRMRSPWTAWPTTDFARLPQGVTLSPSAAAGHELFTRYSCLSCHAVGDEGGKVGPNLSALASRLSQDELRGYIKQPPKDVPMPAYGHRLSDEELTSLVDFVLVAQTFPRKY